MDWTFDLEADNWDEVTNACFANDAGNIEHFEGERSIEHAADFIDEVKGTHLGHAAGIYDTLLVTQARERPWTEVVMSGSAVLTAKDRNIRVRDSFRWTLASLRKMGEFLDKEDTRRREERRRFEQDPSGYLRTHDGKQPEAPHGEPGKWLKKDVPRHRMKELTPTERKSYCESDTLILGEAKRAAIGYLEARGARKAWTAGSSALSLLECLEKPIVGLMKRYALDSETAKRACLAVRGARVETWALGRIDNVYCYDRKSAYPAAYANKTVGLGAIHLDGDDEGPPGTVWRCRWFWPWRGGESELDERARIPPVLDQLTGAGAGWCEAWCIDEEIEALSEWVSVQRLEGWAPQVMAPVGQVFCRELYEEKERGSFFAKVFLNSLHGKMSESPIKECWTSGAKPVDYIGPAPELIGDYWRYLKLAVDKNDRCAFNVQPVAAAHTLGRARIALWRLISRLVATGFEVYYCDTDSIHTNAPPAAVAALFGREYGFGLGQLAPEGGPFTCFYVGPKSYCAVDPTTGKVVKGACKGIPWGSLKDGVKQPHNLYGNLYRQARDAEAGQDLRLAVFEEALREHTGAKVKKEGIATWKQGLRLKAGWCRYETVRTLEPHERGKVFDRRAGPTAWAYRSPAELLLGRGVDLSHDPFLALATADGADGEPVQDEVADFFETH